MKHLSKLFFSATLLLCFLFSACSSYADGSKDLYPAGVAGQRVFLFSCLTRLNAPEGVSTIAMTKAE